MVGAYDIPSRRILGVSVPGNYGKYSIYKVFLQHKYIFSTLNCHFTGQWLLKKLDHSKKHQNSIQSTGQTIKNCT